MVISYTIHHSLLSLRDILSYNIHCLPTWFAPVDVMTSFRWDTAGGLNHLWRTIFHGAAGHCIVTSLLLYFQRVCPPESLTGVYLPVRYSFVTLFGGGVALHHDGSSLRSSALVRPRARFRSSLGAGPVIGALPLSPIAPLSVANRPLVRESSCPCPPTGLWCVLSLHQ